MHGTGVQRGFCGYALRSFRTGFPCDGRFCERTFDRIATVNGFNVERAVTAAYGLHTGNYGCWQKPMRLLRELFRATLGTKIISVALILVFRSRLTSIYGHAP